MTDGEILDAIVFRTMRAEQLIEHIHIYLMGPVEDDTKVGIRRRNPSRKTVESYVASLVEKYGGGLGGLTRVRLVSRVMKRVETRQRRQARTDWAAYYASHGNAAT